ncbi:MAG: SIS domain-containing protein, partial [Myxococcota bacterium]
MSWEDSIDEHLEVVRAARGALAQPLAIAVERCHRALLDGGKIMVCGNGGSAADAQHFSTELSGRFFHDRPAIAAVALTTDSSALTAIANDMGFDEIFARQVDAIGLAGDVLIAISTSGNSRNVLRAVEQAKARDVYALGLTGENGGRLGEEVELCIKAPSAAVPRIQEVHELVLH